MNSSANSCSVMSTPHTERRSVTASRWGEVYSPVVSPCAQAIAVATRGGRALAVRARHVDRRVRQLRVVEVGREREDARQVGHHARFLAGLELRERLRRDPSSRSGRPRTGGVGLGASTVSTENVSASACSIARMLPASRRSAEAWLSRRSRSCVSCTVTESTGDLQRHLRERLLLAHRASARRRRPRRPRGRASPPPRRSPRSATGHAARCTEPSRHQDQTSSVTYGRNGANSRSSTSSAVRRAPTAEPAALGARCAVGALLHELEVVVGEAPEEPSRSTSSAFACS